MTHLTTLIVDPQKEIVDIIITIIRSIIRLSRQSPHPRAIGPESSIFHPSSSCCLITFEMWRIWVGISLMRPKDTSIWSTYRSAVFVIQWLNALALCFGVQTTF